MSVHQCPFNHEKLVGYASGNLDPKDRVVVERHLAQCPVCRQEVRILEQTWWTLDVWEFEADYGQPKLGDFKRRVAETKQAKNPWLRFSEMMYAWQLHFRPAPTLAFATMACLLFLLPLFQDYVANNSSGIAPKLANHSEKKAKPQKDQIANATSAIQSRDPEYIRWKEQRDHSFEMALRLGRMQDTSLGGTYPMNGFAPNADVYSAEMDSLSNQPFVSTDRYVQGERVRLGN